MPRCASAKTSSILGWELLLFALPVMGLVAFGFVALRWDERAQWEEVRARCAGLVEPLRQDLRDRLARIDLFPGPEEPAVNQPPVPGEPSDSQEQFQDGNYAAVLGNARAPSESGLPLRPLAALRLLREESNPERLHELAGVIVSEPSIVTPRLLEAVEARYRALGLDLPESLGTWRADRKQREAFAEFWASVDPLVADEHRFGGMAGPRSRWVVLQDGERVQAFHPDQFEEAVAAASRSAEAALPPGVVAGVHYDRFPPQTEGTLLIEDPGLPSIRFAIGDSALFRSAVAGRRTFFYSFLIIAALLSAFGIVMLARTVQREREYSERTGNLVAAVSHEMRTPVASIRLLAENLESGTADTAARRDTHLQQLVEQSERLSGLVENVLAYSRRAAGRESWNVEDLAIGALLDESVDRHAALAESLGVRIRAQAGEFPAPPRGDRAGLSQALVNLIENALKHSTEGGEVTCGAEARPGGSRRWLLWVEDDGPGVPPAERRKIFEPFYRVGSELRRETKGTGLGLALVLQVAGQHGGEVTCTEASGGGARFQLLLPLDPEHPDNHSR